MAPPTKKHSHESDDLLSSEDEDPSKRLINLDNWPRFLVMSAIDGGPLKLNTFAVAKGIEGLAGEAQ